MHHHTELAASVPGGGHTEKPALLQTRKMQTIHKGLGSTVICRFQHYSAPQVLIPLNTREVDQFRVTRNSANTAVQLYIPNTSLEPSSISKHWRYLVMLSVIIVTQNNMCNKCVANVTDNIINYHMATVK